MRFSRLGQNDVDSSVEADVGLTGARSSSLHCRIKPSVENR
jgi:hypothetical protein